jgi:putative tryptophan/tyrosine transport system substrate-binding protein
MRLLTILILSLLLYSCSDRDTSDVPVVGFVDGFEDETLDQARQGFYDALAAGGFSESDSTVRIIYRNAQGNIPTLTQIVQYYISERVDLMATNPTLSTITAVQKTRDIPIFQMVASDPAIIGLTDTEGSAPPNLFGAKEILAYIDTSFSLIPAIVQPKGSQLVVGMIFNQAEPQSVDALNRIKELADELGVRLEALPVNTSADAQLVTRSLLSRNIDAFFANPDNTVFASFETILAVCNDNNVPIFTSEAGLVSRGAVAAYGADIYQWGYQAGEQAAQFLKNGTTDGLALEMVKLRRHVYNPAAASRFGLSIPPSYEAID